MRRNRRSPNASNGSWGQVMNLFHSVFTADKFTVDGTTGKVASFTDWRDSTHTVAQSTEANQCVIPTGVSGLNGRLGASFSSTWYDSNRAASTWKFLHDGTGCEVIRVFVPGSVTGTTYPVATRSGGAAQHGFGSLRNAAAAGAILLSAGNTVLNGQAGTLVVGTPTWTDFYYQEGLSGAEYEVFLRSTSVTSGNSSIAPSSSNPSATLRLGARTDGTGAETETWCATLIANRVLSSDERTLVRSAILQRYGV